MLKVSSLPIPKTTALQRRTPHDVVYRQRSPSQCNIDKPISKTNQQRNSNLHRLSKTDTVPNIPTINIQKPTSDEDLSTVMHLVCFVSFYNKQHYLDTYN
jgi:hypothetical protein